MNTLYATIGSGNCFKPFLVMKQLGIPFRVALVDVLKGETRMPAYLAVNPNGTVPYLALADGRGIGESNAMLWHLAEGSRLIPATLTIAPRCCSGCSSNSRRSSLSFRQRGFSSRSSRRDGPSERRILRFGKSADARASSSSIITCAAMSSLSMTATRSPTSACLAIRMWPRREVLISRNILPSLPGSGMSRRRTASCRCPASSRRPRR